MSNFSFGAPPNATVAPNLSAPTTAPTFGFGTGTTPTFGTPGTLGTSTSTALPTFGTPAASTGLSFGGLGTTSTAPTFGGTSGGSLTFNAPATSASTLTFGATTTAPTLNLSFGATPASTATSTGFSFSAAPTSTAAPTFGLGTGFSATPQTSLSTGFGGLAPTTSSVGFGLGGTSLSTGLGGLGGAAKPTLTLGLGGLAPASQAAPAAAPPFVGLGGVDTGFSTSGGQAGQNAEQTCEKAAKDNFVPPEILQQFDEFKEFLKIQKQISSEFSRNSTKPLQKIQSEIKTLMLQLDSIHNQLQSFSSIVKHMRNDTSKSLQHAEMAQTTYETPSNFQLEYVAPDEYFIDLAVQTEENLIAYRKEIENMEKLLQQVSDTSAVNKDVVILAVKHQHNIFVALASRLHSLHTYVEQQKQACLLLRRQFLQDKTDIFQLDSTSTNREYVTSYRHRQDFNRAGPPLFASSTNISGPQYSLNQSAMNKSSFSNSMNFGTGQNTSFLGGNTSSFLGSSDGVENRPFQLQQPPNKRGKRFNI